MSRRATTAPIEVTDACTACGACLPTCPERCLVPVGGRPPLVVLAEACTACMLCVEVCPADAIRESGAFRESGATREPGATREVGPAAGADRRAHR